MADCEFDDAFCTVHDSLLSGVPVDPEYGTICEIVWVTMNLRAFIDDRTRHGPALHAIATLATVIYHDEVLMD